MKKIWLLFFLIIFIVGCETPPNSNSDLNQPFGDEGLVLTVESIRQTQGQQFGEAPENTFYLLIDMTIENTSDNRKTITTSLMFELFGDEGGTYQVDNFILSETDLQTMDTTLDPNESRNGTLPFIVSEADTEWELMFAPDVFTGQIYSIHFDLDDFES